MTVFTWSDQVKCSSNYTPCIYLKYLYSLDISLAIFSWFAYWAKHVGFIGLKPRDKSRYTVSLGARSCWSESFSVSDAVLAETVKLSCTGFIAFTTYWDTHKLRLYKYKPKKTKASSHAGQCIPAGSRRVLNTMSIIAMRSISRKLCVGSFTLCKIRPQFYESYGATYRRIWEMFSGLQSTSGPATDVEHSVKSMHNWRRYPSSNWYEIDQKRGSKFGALLWRHLTPQRKTAI